MDYKDKFDRLEKEIVCYKLLDDLGIKYSSLDHASASTIVDCIDIDKALGVKISKNLFLLINDVGKQNF